MPRFLIALLLVLPASALYAQQGDKIFDNSFVHEIRVYSSDPAFWDKLIENFNSTIDAEENIYIPADLVIDGTSVNSVGFRIKGYTSSFFAPVKKPFRIDFNSFVKGQQYDGLKKLSLNNAATDPTMMRDVLAFNLFRKAGVAASRTSYAKVYINDTYWGLYVLVEQVDKEFAETHLNHDSGNLFKCTNAYDLSYKGDNYVDYKPFMALKTNESENDWSGFINFVKYVSHEGISESEFNTTFPEMFDIESFLKIIAVDILILNWDSYYDHGRNWYLYENTDTHKFSWIPWDYNFSFSSMEIDVLAENPQFIGTPKPLIRNLLKNEKYRKMLGEAYSEILYTNFTENRLFALIDEYEALITNDLEQDPNKGFEMETFHNSLNQDIFRHHEDTFKIENRMDQVFIINPLEPIPDSILNSGLMLLDTTWFNRVEFDTLLIENVPVTFIKCYFFSSYDEHIIGLRSFITRRIHQVKAELEDLDLWYEYVVSAEDDQTSALTLYPNPAGKILNVTAPFDLKRASISIVDVNGKEIPVALRGTVVDVSALPRGMYLLQVKAGSTIVRSRFIRE